MVFVGLDIGTSGTRGIAIDEQGRVLASATTSYPLHMPRPGWTEQDPEDWWQATCTVLRALTAELSRPVTAIGLTGQMHGAVFLDEHDRVIRPAILWNDQRTARQCQEIEERVGSERLRAIAGNPALTGFQAPKILWLREEEPHHYARVRRVLLPKDFIRLRLTGEAASDASDAAGTLLLDLAKRDWSDELLAALDLPRAWFPRVFEGPEPTGTVRSSVAAELGLPPSVVVAAGAGDNAAAAVATGIVRAGRMSVSIGTSGVLFVHSDTLRFDPEGRVHAFCHCVPGAYHLMAVTLSAGGSLRWWRDVVGDDYQALADAAAAVPPGSEGLLFLPYLTGERTPHRDPYVRGAFVGLTARHSRAHLTRAVMEGVVFSLRDGYECLQAVGIGDCTDVRITGGGARHPLWRQLVADILEVPVRTLAIDEGAAYGAALLGAVAAEAFRSVEEASQVVRLQETVTWPDPERCAQYRQLFPLYRALYEPIRAVSWKLAGAS